MPTTHLFIDTNVFLNFYHFADDNLEQLEKLRDMIGADGIRLHLPIQVRNELTRNREAKLKAANDQFTKESLPSAVPRHMQRYPQYAEYVAVIEKAKKLRSQLVNLSVAHATSTELETDKLIRSVFDKANKYPEDDNVFAVALQRMQKGNPPGKSGSVGDQYNWETLLKEVPKADLHVVSKDGDYASLLNKSRPHPSLEAEWMEKKSGHLHIYSELRAFLKKYDEILAQETLEQPTPPLPIDDVLSPTELLPPPVLSPEPLAPQDGTVKVDDPKMEEAVQMLVNSGSFSKTHAAIALLTQFKSTLRLSDARRLIRAAVENDQIRWIASDSDVYAFFAAILTEHSNIDADLFEEAVEVFGLQSTPDDSFDHAQ